VYGFQPNDPATALTKIGASAETRQRLADLPALREHLREDAKVAMDFAAVAAKVRW